MADLLGGRAEEIAFGQNMTSLTLAVSRALARDWHEGDEIVVTRFDHDANIAPWLLAAEDRGVTVRMLEFDTQTGELRLDLLPGLLGNRTRLVAMAGASNSLGTLNDVTEVVEIVRRHSDALVFVDAVQSVPHVPTDVAALGCDLLVFSPYKMFGPHQGVLWGRAAVLQSLHAYKVRPASTSPAAIRFETGTQSFEGQAGVNGMIAYLDWLGGELMPTAIGRRGKLLAALDGCVAYERLLGDCLLAGLQRLPGVQLYGRPDMERRVPTFGFTVDGRAPVDVVRHLADCGIFAWAGHFYAIETIKALGLSEQGGLVRVGLCHYNTADEVDRMLGALHELVKMERGKQ